MLFRLLHRMAGVPPCVALMDLQRNLSRPLAPPPAPAALRLVRARHLIVDLDGTLIREDELLDGAAELLDRFRDRYVIVSNNSTHTARGVASRLARLGLKVPAARIVLAGEQTIDFMRQLAPQSRVQVAGSRALVRYAVARGCVVVRDAAEFVVFGLDPDFNQRRLTRIVNALRSGAQLVVTNTDASHPGPGGTVVPETGAQLAAVLMASGATPLHVIGKPEAPLLEEGLRRLGALPGDTVVIGDNPATDAAGARRMGMSCLLVGAAPQADAPTLQALLCAADGLLATAHRADAPLSGRAREAGGAVLQ